MCKDKNVYITVDVEEWFHTNWFDVPDLIENQYNGTYPESDVVKTTAKLADTFDSYNAKGTFFVLGETAERYPEIMEILKGSDHEIACHGWYHNGCNDLEFKKGVSRFKDDVYPEAIGFRFPNFGYSTERFRLLAREGFRYDSSVVPCLNIPGWYGNPKSPIEPYDLNLGNENTMTEFPMSVLPYVRLPGAGGWFLRNIGYQWTKNIVKYSMKKTGASMIYLHPWEISNSNPSHSKDVPFHVFRNTGNKMLQNLIKLMESFSANKFLTLSDALTYTAGK